MAGTSPLTSARWKFDGTEDKGDDNLFIGLDAMVSTSDKCQLGRKSSQKWLFVLQGQLFSPQPSFDYEVVKED